MTTDERQGRGEGGDGLAAEIAEAERRERGRLAEALHDDALQRLLIARQDLVEASDDPAALEHVAVQLGELTESLRSLTVALHEESLAAMPLHAALERLAADAARRGRLAVTTRVDPAATGDHDPFVLGIVRELLANVVKHAEAAHAEIAVTRDAGLVLIRVTDDGRGITPADVERADRSGHLGHARLRRRLDAIGGRLELARHDGPGTTVTCTLPLETLGAQRTLEDALRTERRWSAALVAAMQDGFVVFRDGAAAQVNDRFCSLTGFSRDELLGRAPPDLPFWPEDDRPELAALVAGADAIAGTDRRAMLLRADGEPFPALIAARSIRDDEGRSAGLLLTVKDVSTLEEAAERRRLAFELDAVVAATRRLRGLLDAARAVTDEPGLHRLLEEIARVIGEDLGWTVCLNLYRPAWDDFVATTAHGVSEEGWAILDGASYEWAHWTPFMEDRFEHRGAYLVPAGEPAGDPETGPTWTPPIEVLDAPDAWLPGDALYIPFRHTLGHFLGIMSLDAPASGRRPSDAELDVLVALAAHAALAVQHAQTAIEGARHAAALDSLLQVSSQIAATRDVVAMLDVVAGAIAEALGFSRVVIETAGPDGRLVPVATGPAEETPPLPPQWAPLATAELDALLDPAFGLEGCFLLGVDEAVQRLPVARRELLGSRVNGRGWRAWQDHLVVVPLYDADDRVAGVIWVDDPHDRLLPGAGVLQALHAFANQASAAMVAADRYERLAGAGDGDPFTMLGNRRAFLRELERETARATRTGTGSVLVLADLQGCDALAAAPGDAALSGNLRELASVFEHELRGHDRIFRVEGGLFALLLTGGQEPPETTAVTLRLAARLRDLGVRAGVRVTFGTATIGPRSRSADAVLRRAGESLLAARGVSP